MSVIVERAITSNADDYLPRLARGLPMVESVEIIVDGGRATCSSPCRLGHNIRVGTPRGYQCTGVKADGTMASQEGIPLYQYAHCGMRL